MHENGKIAVFEGKRRRFRILPKVYNLTVSRIINQCGRKRCQKKRKDVSCQFKEFFKNILLFMNGWQSKIWLVHTYGVRYIHVFARQCRTSI